MTIRQFAGLCGCNPQTLRYYDHVQLLKPNKVDEWTGYRYYEEEQAMDFVKIKNLQKAGFSIGEIKALLGQDNPAIFAAFEEKIREAEGRLREIREIQRSYRNEMDQMKDRIDEIKAELMAAMAKYDVSEEFDIPAEKYQDIVRRIEGWLVSDESSLSPEEADMPKPEKAQQPDPLKDPEYAPVYEKHGWTHVKEFLDEFSELEDGSEYCLVFQRTELEPGRISPFANVLLNLLLERNPGKKRTLSCDVKPSPDGENHFWMLKKRQ